MRLKNVRILGSILLLSQLRVRGRAKQSWGGPRGLLAIHAAVFAGAFALVSYVLGIIPAGEMAPLQQVSLQVLALIPVVLLSFMILYSILFVIGEATQYSSSELINYMPVTAAEYVLASSLSTVFISMYILTGILGISLALAMRFDLVWMWAASSALSAFFAVVGSFVGEIIRALMNRVSSSFSKRGGRSAIVTRAVLIIVVLAVFQIFFNPNIMFRVLQAFAPQIYVLWFLPLVWPSVAILNLSAGNFAGAALFTVMTIAFGLVLMACGVFLRSKYWMPLPVSIKIGSAGAGSYRRAGLLSRLGFTQAESAIISKDARSLFRRKEMVRYLALPIIIMIPMLLTSGSVDEPGALLPTALMISLLGSSMFGLFLSIISIAQEGRAIWNLYASPLNAGTLFKAKIAAPLLISSVPALALPAAVSLLFRLTPFIAAVIFSSSILMTAISVLIGSYIGPKYIDLEEKPRNNFIKGTGMLVAFLMEGAVGLVCLSPLVLYVVARQLALSIGLTSPVALAASVAVSAVFIVLLYRMAAGSVRTLFAESPLE